MKELKSIVAFAAALLMLAASSVFASSHREAPITALDHSADVTDWYAFVSYDNPNNVTFILNVDPLLEPANGPNYFPFDPSVLYQMLIDNNQDGNPDVVFQFRFTTQIRRPNLYTGFIGGLDGIPQITSLSGTGSEGLSLSQTYTVTMVKNGVSTCLNCGQTLYAVPSNVGPATMPNYQALFSQGIYSLGNGISVWAGTADDPFFIDLGAAFDSLNFRSGIGPVLPPSIDADDTHNYAPDAVGGYNVNSIVLEVPITMLTVDGQIHPSSDKQAVIGTYGSTSRNAITVRRSPNPDQNYGAFQQVNREGNPLINELVIGTGFKDRFSMDFPVNDSQFANFVLNPALGAEVPVLDGAGVQKMKQDAFAAIHADRIAGAERFVVDGKNVGRYLQPHRPRIQHRRPFWLCQRGIEIVGVHHLVGEIGLPIAQRQVVFLIEAAGIIGSLDDQKAEHSGVTATVQVVHRHGVGVVPAGAGGRGRESIAAASVRRHRGRALLLRSIHVGRDKQSVKMHKLRHVSVINHVHRDRHALLHAQPGPWRGAVVPDSAENAIGRQFDSDGRDLQGEIGLGHVLRLGWRQKGLILVAHQPATCGRRTGDLEEVASLHEK
jgi:hypothetical protein